MITPTTKLEADAMTAWHVARFCRQASADHQSIQAAGLILTELMNHGDPRAWRRPLAGLLSAAEVITGGDAA